MEHIHGVDVSWMTHGNPKGKVQPLSVSLDVMPPNNPHHMAINTGVSITASTGDMGLFPCIFNGEDR